MIPHPLSVIAVAAAGVGTALPEEDWVIRIGAYCFAVGAIVVLLRPITKKIRHNWKRFGWMMDDWFGEPARPGQPERPGVMARLDKVEVAQHESLENQDEMREDLNTIKQSSIRRRKDDDTTGEG